MSLSTDPASPPFAPDLRTRIYIWLAAFSCACLLIADIVGVKLFDIQLLGYSVKHTCGMLTFPITFLLTDLLNEFYGKKAARRVAILSFTMALFAFIILNISQAMPYLDAPFNVKPDAFDAIFGAAKVMYVASLSAYLVGSLADIWVFGRLKNLTRGRLIWLRATGSTVLSQMIDSFIVSYLAFGLGRQLFPSPDSPPASFREVLSIAATGYTLKFALAILITPLVYAGHGFLRRGLGINPVPPDSPSPQGP